MPNSYTTVDDFRNAILARESEAVHEWESEAQVLGLLVDASRVVDQRLGRPFFTVSDTRYWDTGDSAEILLLGVDLLSITTLKTDEAGDYTYNTTWTEGLDFLLWPWNVATKWQVWRGRESENSFSVNQARWVEIEGVFGHGDGKSADPWRLTAVDVTADDGAETELDVSEEGIIKAGHTIRVEDEQIFVEAATSDSTKKITVERGVNLTTGAEHAAKAASIALYPGPVSQAALHLAVAFFNSSTFHGFARQTRDGFWIEMLRDLGIIVDRVAQTLAWPNGM